MDLDDFEQIQNAQNKDTTIDLGTSDDASSALEYFDAVWYSFTSRRGRVMDLIGDYGGNELFIIDGESLFQNVLDDHLLALADEEDPSFQILHALYALECTLNDFRKRSAVFDVVFFNDTRHRTLGTGGHPFVLRSRSLARAILYQHLKTLDISVHSFDNTSDPRWISYLKVHRPMFALLNDGGPVEATDSPLEAECVLQQRTLIFDLISQGVSVALLEGAEFRDSKISSLVIEQRQGVDARGQLKAKHWQRVEQALVALNSEETRIRGGSLPISLHHFSTPTQQGTIETVVSNVLSAFLALKPRREVGTPELLFAFVAHLLLLPELPIQDRARPTPNLGDSLNERLLSKFLPLIFTAVETVQATDHPLDIDGRVFIELLLFLMQHPDMPLSEAVGEEVANQLTMLWKLHKLPSANFASLAPRYPHPAPEARDSEEPETFGVLPFHNAVFDDLLSDVYVEVDEQEEQSGAAQLEFSQAFVDLHHWHNHRRPVLPKHLGGDNPKPANQWQRMRQLRRNQNFMAQLERQANTLTGAFGKTLQRLTITGSSDSTNRRNEQHAQAPSRKQAKAVKESAAQRIRREHAEKKQAEEDESNQKWWTNELQRLSSMPLSQKVVHIENMLRNSKRANGNGWLAVEMRLYELNLEILSWLEHPDHDSTSHASRLRDDYTVSIMRKVKTMSENGGLFYAASKAIASVLVALGLTELLAELVDSSPNARDDDKRRLNFEFVKLIKSKSGSPIHKFMRITEDPVIWQLRLFGEYMDRSMDSQPDPRVSFEPDAWQRKVLDCLDDEGHSVLVVAPTSAGKTFISYYAMEKVLRSNDDDLLVYVAPTKALVAQIAAEVCARFSKSYKTGSCWAIHTRDYRINDPINCQILVTVPEVLASLLLSPPLANVWTPRIKRIILDEIHSIGQQEGGAVWEQIILLAPCPIIGLSATVGNPEQFNTWLESVQTAHGFKHSFIQHPHRYSHLRKFFYLFSEKAKTASSLALGLNGYRDTDRLRFLHPVSMLSFGVRDLPPDFALEASDCLSLYRALTSLNVGDNDKIQSLDPSTYFHRNTLLRQKDIIQYEENLKDVLNNIISISDPQDPESPLQRVAQHVQDPAISRLSIAQQNALPSKQAFFDNLLPFVADLHSKGDLPAILFNFDRTACEKMAIHIVNALEAAEQEWRKGPEWQEKLRQWERWQMKVKDRQRQAQKAAKRDKKNKDEEHVESTRSWEETFDPDDPSPQFSFASAKGSYTKTDLMADLEDIRWVNIPLWALNCLRRGIAVHHAGMNKHYRTLIESLFRLGYVRVVIATGTLALGINAPAKTSVFCGDSPFLTALQFRQCAGRAGRRGFDLLGKVVFYGLAMDRAQRLVLSKLPSLGGNFPLTSTMVLRLFNLLQGSNYAPTAVTAIQRLLTLPHVSFISDTGKHQLLHHIRFSIDYLRRAGLLDASGNPIDLFGIAAHLYYTEPSNLALVALFRKGVIHRICGQPSMINAKRDFFLLMAHLFNRQKIPKVYTSAANIKEQIRKSPSMVILPPLPDRAREVLVQHDEEILQVFSGYAKAFATHYQKDLGSDHTLPFSSKTYPVPDVAGKSTNQFQADLRTTAVRVKLRSVFVANSGHTDCFESVSELSQTARTGLHLNDHAIPTMHSFTTLGSDGDLTFALNAYLLDFYIHGQTQPLVVANGIRRGDLWYLLQDFTLALKAVRSSLEELLLGVSKGNAEGDEDLEGSVTAVDPAERDDDSDDDRTRVDSETVVKRPRGVSDRDWRVFEIVDAVTNEFEEKFKAMWA
ncbi:unnamed protein product [Somion occarium]|uniref:P-loop containing nucleoside triphosphate hydrolase protein n=1 Tax=Somion occarium TaxID=3059160 RepID=A0ABP1CVX1_9APHY